MVQKLNQVIAVEKGLKSRVYAETTEMHKRNQKVDLFNGMTRTYQPIEESGETLPNEVKSVQYSADTVISRFKTILTELFDIVYAKDCANTQASASITTQDRVILEDVPATYLLFLEKQIVDIREFISKLPDLDTSETWKKSDQDGLYYTEPTSTHRTKKTQKALVLYPATPEHPAQTQLITEDILAGYWRTIHISGGISKKDKEKILERIDTLAKAIKYARESANETIISPEVESISPGKELLNYIFKDI